MVGSYIKNGSGLSFPPGFMIQDEGNISRLASVMSTTIMYFIHRVVFSYPYYEEERRRKADRIGAKKDSFLAPCLLPLADICRTIFFFTKCYS